MAQALTQNNVNILHQMQMPNNSQQYGYANNQVLP